VRLNEIKLSVAVLMSSSAAVLSLSMIQFPSRIGPGAILAAPGAILGIITSGNVHAFATWVVVLGNSVFYFGAVYFVWGIWELVQRRAKSPERDQSSWL